MRLLEALQVACRDTPHGAAMAITARGERLLVRFAADRSCWEVMNGDEAGEAGEPVMQATLVEISAIMREMPGGLDWQPVPVRREERTTR